MITVDYRDRRPIYQQLIDKIEALIAGGFLSADSQLPSVRQLAVELAINPNTIQRAYAELESRGAIYSVAGRGSFVCSSTAELTRIKQDELREKLAATVNSAQELGMTEADFIRQVQELWSARPVKGGVNK